MIMVSRDWLLPYVAFCSRMVGYRMQRSARDWLVSVCSVATIRLFSNPLLIQQIHLPLFLLLPLFHKFDFHKVECYQNRLLCWRVSKTSSRLFLFLQQMTHIYLFQLHLCQQSTRGAGIFPLTQLVQNRITNPPIPFIIIYLNYFPILYHKG